ncbi:MAG: group 1 truncated hemoglobin [Sphingomonadales bacterium]
MPTQTNTATPFDRLGGKPAIDAAVDIFYQKVLADPHIAHFFDTVDMKRQRIKQKAFLTMAFGGPVNYSGKDMRRAHAALVDNGLDDSHFDAVAGHLQATLQELKVAPDLVAEVLAIAESTRTDVLGR